MPNAQVGVGPERPVDLSVGGFLWPALRTGRATFTASGSPRTHTTDVGCRPSLQHALDPQYPRLGVSVGDGASVFTGDLLAFQSTCCGFAALLRHVVGFPDLGLLRGLRPISGSSVDDGPARHRPGWTAGRAIPRWFPRSPCTGRRGRCPALLRQSRHGYAAGLPRGLPTGIRNRLRSRPPTGGGRALLTGPYPPGWSRRPITELSPLVQTAFTPSRLTCRTRTVWWCRPVPALSGLLPPSPTSPGSGCPQLQRPAATGPRWSPFTSTRYMAPRGAPEHRAQ